jgi:hypothetical protein
MYTVQDAYEVLRTSGRLCFSAGSPDLMRPAPVLAIGMFFAWLRGGLHWTTPEPIHGSTWA